MADYGIRRNGSGYNDPTAYKAVTSMAKAGEIWTANDGREEVLIIQNHGSFCNVLSLTDHEADKRCIECRGMYTNPAMLKYLTFNKIGYYVDRLNPEAFEEIRQEIRVALGFGTETEEKPVAEKKTKKQLCHELLDMIMEGDEQ